MKNELRVALSVSFKLLLTIVRLVADNGALDANSFSIVALQGRETIGSSEIG